MRKKDVRKLIAEREAEINLLDCLRVDRLYTPEMAYAEYSKNYNDLAPQEMFRLLSRVGTLIRTVKLPCGCFHYVYVIGGGTGYHDVSDADIIKGLTAARFE